LLIQIFSTPQFGGDLAGKALRWLLIQIFSTPQSKKLKQERELDFNHRTSISLIMGRQDYVIHVQSEDRQFAESLLEFARRNFREQTFSAVVSEKRLPTGTRLLNFLQCKAIGKLSPKIKGVPLVSTELYKEIRRLRGDAY
jgi:hypothetical protein